jgi:hypothetical protein
MNMPAVEEIVVNDANQWRLDAPAVAGWKKNVRPGPNKYFMISCDTHLMPPVTLFRDRLDKKWHDKLPRIEKRDDGERGPSGSSISPSRARIWCDRKRAGTPARSMARGRRSVSSGSLIRRWTVSTAK